LAELEAGRGNISVLLLARIATALDQPIEALIADVSEPDALELAARVGEAPPAQQDAIRRMLDANRPATPIQAGRICLIGLRGAGKSTLGQLAAEALDAPFVELSDEIETHAGLPVAEVMALYGQEGYRQLERQAIARVRDRYDRVILAVAGGIVSESETYGLLLRHFHSIWLKAAPDDHMNRVLAQGDQRPIKGRPRPMDELNAILERRHTLYAKAEAAVETSGKSVKDAAAEVVRAVQSLTA
jgi:XRE family aerobic/anaerobic benzoate catabolism transcriptional regulator